MPKKRDVWLRLYVKMLHSRKVQTLPDRLFKWFVNLLLEARKNEGILPSAADIAWDLNCKESVVADAIGQLRAKELIDEVDGYLIPHDWDEYQQESDVSTERVKRFRERRRNVSLAVSGSDETPNVTSQSRAKQSKAEQPQPPSPNGSGKKTRKSKPELTALQRERFDGTFWKLYYRREDKADAMRTFARVITTDEEWERCVAKLKKLDHKVEFQYRKLPATWLNKTDFTSDDNLPEVQAGATQPAAASMDEWVPPDYGPRDEDYSFAFEQD